jgi:hypothetical protein
METRAAPARALLDRLAVTAGLPPDVRALPRRELLEALRRDAGDLGRLLRRVRRQGEEDPPRAGEPRRGADFARARSGSTSTSSTSASCVSTGRSISSGSISSSSNSSSNNNNNSDEDDDDHNNYSYIHRKRSSPIRSLVRGGAAPVSPSGSKRKAAESPARERGKHRTCGEAEEVDPITMDRIPSATRFTFVRPNGSRASFDALALVDYMLASGDFSDPLSRVPFSAQDLQRLDDIAAQHCGSSTSSTSSSSSSAAARRESVVAASCNVTKFKADKSHWDGLLGLERYLGEQVCAMMALIESVNSGEASAEEAEAQLLSEIVPTFTHNFELLAGLSPSFAKQSLAHFASFLRGPPNRETRNRDGFATYVIALLRMFEQP